MPLVLIFTFSPRRLRCSRVRAACACEEFLVRSGDAGLEADPRRPAEAPQASDVEELARRAVGLARVELERAAEPHDRRYRARQLGDRLVLAAADIDQRKFVRPPEHL